MSPCEGCCFYIRDWGCTNPYPSECDERFAPYGDPWKVIDED